MHVCFLLDLGYVSRNAVILSYVSRYPDLVIRLSYVRLYCGMLESSQWVALLVLLNYLLNITPPRSAVELPV
jgi:hypothetical protein